jgi:DNA-binding HxlR family transcriptional regulator
MAKLAETETCGTKCPLRRTLAVIEGKYTPLILKELFNGTKRFGQLRRHIQGISPKTLSDKLKDLISKGVVERISYPEVPPKVEYRLTFRGTRMKGIVQQLQEFWQEEAESSHANAPAADEASDEQAAPTDTPKKPARPRSRLPVEMHLLAQNRADD